MTGRRLTRSVTAQALAAAVLTTMVLTGGVLTAVVLTAAPATARTIHPVAAASQLRQARTSWTSGARTRTADVARARWDAARWHLSAYGPRFAGHMRDLVTLYDLPDPGRRSAAQTTVFRRTAASLDAFFGTPGLYVPARA